jgi:hypothetical protein
VRTRPRICAVSQCIDPLADRPKVLHNGATHQPQMRSSELAKSIA